MPDQGLAERLRKIAATTYIFDPERDTLLLVAAAFGVPLKPSRPPKSPKTGVGSGVDPVLTPPREEEVV